MNVDSFLGGSKDCYAKIKNESIFAGVRNPKEAQRNIEKLIDMEDVSATVDYQFLDTGNLKSVRQFASAVRNKYAKIDILINNAGVMATPYHLTEDGFESQFAINYLGHFLLTHLLLPQLKAAGTQDLNARIVNVSSCAHRTGRINFDDINGKYVPLDLHHQGHYMIGPCFIRICFCFFYFQKSLLPTGRVQSE